MTTTPKTHKQAILDFYFNPKNAEILKQKEIGENEKKVHLAMTALCDDSTHQVEITPKKLAKITSLNKKDVEKSLKILLKAGFLKQ